jgi:hypothetical protein
VKRARSILIVGAAALAAHAGLASGLDALGAGDRLLASGGAGLGWALLLVAFLALRLLLYFVVPGLVAGALVLALASRR